MAEPRPQLTDILDVDQLASHLEAGNIRRQHHPSLPYAILNYTERAVFDQAWDHVTLTCRGLIYDHDDGTVLARPFRKFFNYGQPGAPAFDLHGPATVTDKADGSLGILYPTPGTPGGWAVATRGSFTSDQALHATRLYVDRYADRFTPDPGTTYLFEIVYPANRVVLDYGDLDDLLLLGAVDNDTGQTGPPDPETHGWPGPAVAVLEHSTLGEALEAPPRENAEGLVVHCVDTDERIKVKQADYVELHRIVTGLNARTVWRHLSDNRPLEELTAPLPDEFHPWVAEVADHLEGEVRRRRAQVDEAYREVIDRMPSGWTRKDFAMEAVKHPDKAYLFALLDGKDPEHALWRDAKPPADWGPARSFGEDVA